MMTPMNPPLPVHTPPGSTLIVDEVPSRLPGSSPDVPGRILLLSERGETLWESSALKMPYDAVPLSDGSYLVNIIRVRSVWRVAPSGVVTALFPVGGYPCSLQLLPDGNFLVAGWDDDVPGFVREWDPGGRLVWSLEHLRWPWKAERLANGSTLVADAGTGRVFEVNRERREVWGIGGLGPAEPRLFDALGPVYCQRLANGNTLVSDRAHSRVVEVRPDGSAVWEVGRNVLQDQYSALRLPNGNTLVADAGHHRVIELAPDCRIVWERSGFGYPAKAYRF